MTGLASIESGFSDSGRLVGACWQALSAIVKVSSNVDKIFISFLHSFCFFYDAGWTVKVPPGAGRLPPNWTIPMLSGMIGAF
jgi:hypothetical protein